MAHLIYIYQFIGDLVDAKLVEGIESKQVESEWKTYIDVVKHCRSLTTAEWLDVRGNHGKYIWVMFLFFYEPFSKSCHFHTYEDIDLLSFSMYQCI